MIKLQKQINEASCLITSFAMILNIPVEEAIKMVGHDGIKIDHEGNRLLKGYHVQEIIDLCISLEYSVTCIQAIPELEDFGLVYKDGKSRLIDYLERFSGVLIGLAGTKRHAVAWNHEECQIYDPNNTIYIPTKDRFSIESFWIVIKMGKE